MDKLNLFSLLIQIFFIIIFSAFASSYKPVIIIHGVLDGPSQFKSLKETIEKVHPSTNVTFINLYDGVSSLIFPLWHQVHKYRSAIQTIADGSNEGVHLICYSQGGLICRGVLSTWNNHTVHNVIMLSTPQMGQYGDTSYFQFLFPGYVKENLYKVVYTSFGQKFAVSNYWNDPHHRELYLNYSAYLAVINNESLNTQSEIYRKNFLQIDSLICIGGPDDGVITPWQSSHFAFYNSTEDLVEYTRQQVYMEDSFGLKTLDKRKSFHFYNISGVKHVDWHKNLTVIYNYILPWLT